MDEETPTRETPITFDEVLTMLVIALKQAGGTIEIPQDVFEQGYGQGQFMLWTEPDGTRFIKWEDEQ